MKNLPQKSSANYANGIWFVHEDDEIIIRIWLSLMTGKEKVYANDDLVVEMRNITSMSTRHDFKYKGHSYDIDLICRDMMGGFTCSFFRDGHLIGVYKSVIDPNTMAFSIEEVCDVEKIKKDALVRFREKGKLALNQYDLDDALIEFQKVISLDEEDSQTYFFMACICSLQEEKAKGMDFLQKALDLDLKGKERVLSDDHLAYLRIQPEFEDFKRKNEL